MLTQGRPGRQTWLLFIILAIRGEYVRWEKMAVFSKGSDEEAAFLLPTPPQSHARLEVLCAISLCPSAGPVPLQFPFPEQGARRAREATKAIVVVSAVHWGGALKTPRPLECFPVTALLLLSYLKNQ